METTDKKLAEDYLLKTKVVKQNGKNKVQFSIGSQYFILDYEGTRVECRWLIGMLETAFKNYHEAKLKEIGDIIDELLKLFDEKILIRNTDNDDDFSRFTKEGLRIIEVLQKLEYLKQRKL